MTLEGEYYAGINSGEIFGVTVAILMTLEGEYYLLLSKWYQKLQVAILMTLEGEYYRHGICPNFFERNCRNPHDIGRRILPRQYENCHT